MGQISFASSTASCAVKRHTESDESKDGHNNHECGALKWTPIEVGKIFIAELFPSIGHQSDWDQEQDEWPADATGI